MSIQTYHTIQKRKPEEYTYELLQIELQSFVESIKRTVSAAELLKTQVDLGIFRRLEGEHKLHKEKQIEFIKTHNYLKENDPDNEDEKMIINLMEQSDTYIHRLDLILPAIEKMAHVFQEEEEEHEREEKLIEQKEEQKSKEQIEEEQMQNELDLVQRGAQEIQQTAVILNSTTHQVDEKISEQHQVVMNVDETIEDAKDEAVEGQNELDKAEGKDKKGKKNKKDKKDPKKKKHHHFLFFHK